LKDEGLLFKDLSDFITVSAKGLQRLDELEFSGAESDQAFVAMWFSGELDAAWERGFDLGIADSGFRAMRIDKKEHANKIDDEIISEIRRSRFVVADFTCELIERDGRKFPAPRGGVYYEAGFAQGLGIPVIWTVREDCIDHVHFDTRQFAHIIWSDPDDLRTKLRNRIGAVIGDRMLFDRTV
jgi:nucleoside 2-deoxyribosyltransferase